MRKFVWIVAAAFAAAFVAGCGEESSNAGYSAEVSKEMNAATEKNHKSDIPDDPPPPNVLSDGKSAEVK
ncbi:MAG: hypothetical protein KIT11_10490 [Fimbriimonadaceae bacterium]|nr:hypothetical protein [Fimbriimonadaceae bacterium]QYK55749.1 MAG: hypothetical protein KF733_12160 [Fimbriimonadaceae bacterium]